MDYVSDPCSEDGDDDQRRIGQMISTPQSVNVEKNILANILANVFARDADVVSVQNNSFLLYLEGVR